MNASKSYLLGGGVVAVIVIGLIVGAIRPHKHAQAAPGSVPEVQVVQVQQQDVPIIHEWIGTLDGLVNADESPGNRVSADTRVSGGFVRQERTTPFSDRPPAV